METQESTAVAIPDNVRQMAALELRRAKEEATSWMIPKSHPEALALAETLAVSGMVPKAYVGEPAKIVVAGMYGADVNLSVLASLRSIAVINGNPGLFGDGMLSVVLNSGDLYHFEETPTLDSDDRVVAYTCVVGRDTLKQGRLPLHTITYTKQMAIDAGYWGQKYPSPWSTNPARMLQMRARSFALRDRFADKLAGMTNSAEELRDIEYAEAQIVSETTAPKETVAEKAQSNAEKMKAKLAAAQKPKTEEPTDAEVVEEKSERTLKKQAIARMGASFTAVELNSDDHMGVILKFASNCLLMSVKKLPALGIEKLNHISDCLEAILTEAGGDIELAKLAISDITAGSNEIQKPEIAAGFVKGIRERQANTDPEPELGM